MTLVSISQLKAQPSKIIDQATDYPVSVGKRGQIQAYLVGKDLYEKLIAYLENYIDENAARRANFSKGKLFEKVAKNLGI